MGIAVTQQKYRGMFLKSTSKYTQVFRIFCLVTLLSGCNKLNFLKVINDVVKPISQSNFNINTKSSSPPTSVAGLHWFFMLQLCDPPW